MRGKLTYGLAAVAVAIVAGGIAWRALNPAPHNVIVFVADGLRSEIVTPETAPAMAAVRSEGVDLRNSHSLYPTVTTPNGSAIATGHRLGDTGDFGNAVYVGPALPDPVASPVVALEDDDALGLMNKRFGGDYLDEISLLQAARAKGYSTAAVGKLGPTAIQDVTARDGKTTVVVDDNSGAEGGLPMPDWLKAALKAAGLDRAAPDRGLNGWAGTAIMPGVHVANTVQQDWFVGVAARILLPRFKAAGKPFVMVFWSRDPDGTQHFQGDSLNRLVPGINGPTSMAGIRNASDDLQRLRDAIKAQGLDATTDVVVTADHGFSVISKQSPGAFAAKAHYDDVPAGFLPPGFLALDLGHALNLPILEPNGLAMDTSNHPKRASAILGPDPNAPEVVIGANGATDLIYLPKADAKTLAQRIVAFLTRQDYVASLFVSDNLGPLPGALPMSAIGLKGAARTPAPSILVGFRSGSTGCARPETCGFVIADSELQQGQGNHGSFGRADTHNFMAAVGPDFKKGFVDPAPVSNADIAPTLAHILKLDMPAKGKLQGRVIAEGLKGGPSPLATTRRTIRSAPAANGFVTVLNLQSFGRYDYYDAAGAPGRVLGLTP